MTIRTLLRLWRVVERSGSKSRNAARLPRVIFIKASDPPITVDRNIEVDLVTTGTELRRLRLHEGLQKNTPVWLRIQIDDTVVKPAHCRVLAGCQFVQLGILQQKVSLPHAALHMGDRVTHHATQARPGLGTVDDLLDRRVKEAAVK